jgi:DNA-binding CsgD family transcriptional regulator
MSAPTFELPSPKTKRNVATRRHGSRGPLEREQEIYRLRTIDGWSLEEIAKRFDITRERVRQILRDYLGVSDTPSAAKARTATRRRTEGVRRRNEMHARANTKARQIIAVWKRGDDPRDIADRLGLTALSVNEVIRDRASTADRAARRRRRRRGAGIST